MMAYHLIPLLRPYEVKYIVRLHYCMNTVSKPHLIKDYVWGIAIKTSDFVVEIF